MYYTILTFKLNVEKIIFKMLSRICNVVMNQIYTTAPFEQDHDKTSAYLKIHSIDLVRLCTDPNNLQRLWVLHADGHVDLDLTGHNGNTMLHISCNWANQNKKHDETILTLLELGANPNMKCKKGEHVGNLTTRLDIGMLLIRFDATYESITPPEHDLFHEKQKALHVHYYKRIYVLLALFHSQLEASNSPLHSLSSDIQRRLSTFFDFI